MRSSNSSTDLLHSSTCWVRPMPRVSVVPWLSCWLMVSDVPCDVPSEVLCEVPVCSVAEWLVPHESFTPMEPPMFRAMLLKAVLDGAMPPMALPAVPSSGPITAPATGIATEATAPPRPRMPAMPPATGETFVTEVPELLPTPPLMPPLTPFRFLGAIRHRGGLARAVRCGRADGIADGVGSPAAQALHHSRALILAIGPCALAEGRKTAVEVFRTRCVSPPAFLPRQALPETAPCTPLRPWRP